MFQFYIILQKKCSSFIFKYNYKYTNHYICVKIYNTCKSHKINNRTTEHDQNEDTSTKIPRDNRYRDREIRERDHERDRDRDRDRGNFVPKPFLDIFYLYKL